MAIVSTASAESLVTASQVTVLDSMVVDSYDGGHSKQKTEYAYDAQGNLVLSIGYRWNKTTSTWVENYNKKYEYTYDEMGNRTSKTEYYKDAESMDWSLRSHAEYYYHNFDTSVPEIGSEPSSKSVKLLHNGQIFILRGDRTYTITGQEVR